MAARTIEQPEERLLTILLTPLMSCSARLTVCSLFVFTTAPHQAAVVLSLYVIGVVLALAKLFSATLAGSEPSLFVVEWLPQYRVPQGKTLLRSTWEKGKGFMKKAGTFILAESVVIWLLKYTGPGGIGVDIDRSFMLFTLIYIPCMATLAVIRNGDGDSGLLPDRISRQYGCENAGATWLSGSHPGRRI